MKKFLPALIALLIIAIAGLGYFLSKTKTSQTIQPPIAQQNIPKTTNVFTSIQDAMAKSLSLKCDYTDDKGNHTLAYIKAGAIRADITNKQAAATNSFIMKNKMMYFWDDAKKQGIVMTIPEITPSEHPSGVMQEHSSPADQSGNVMSSLEKFKEHCKSAIVADTLFIQPSDVAFSDLSKMMVPSSNTTGSPAMNQAKIQQMMQQYAHPTTPANQ